MENLAENTVPKVTHLGQNVS